MTDLVPAGDGVAADPAKIGTAQSGIRDWISRAGHTLLHLGQPAAVIAGVTAAAIAPVVVAAAPVTAPAIAALLSQLGGVGSGYLTNAVYDAVGRWRHGKEPAALTEEMLRDVLRECLDEALSGEHESQVRTEITAVVHTIDGVRVALDAAAVSDVPGLMDRFTQAVGELSQSADEFRVLADDVRRGMDGVQRTVLRVALTEEKSAAKMTQISEEVTRLRLDFEARFGPSADGRDSEEAAPDVQPYPGLASFDLPNAKWFHGRTRLVSLLIDRMVRRMHGDDPLIVMGSSGAGKSSVLGAGLLRHARETGIYGGDSRHWISVFMTPDEDPLLQLAIQLAQPAGLPAARVKESIKEDPAAIAWEAIRAHARQHHQDLPDSVLRDQRMILIIDQFEALFTRAPRSGDDRQAFINVISALARSSQESPPPALVVIGLNSAYVDECMKYPLLKHAFDNPFIVGAMTDRELRDAIEEPAREAGLSVEPGLADQMLSDLGVESYGTGNKQAYEPGRLPLLAHALFETWKNRDGNVLTRAAYVDTGGIRGAIATTADRLYKPLDDAAKQVADRLLLHMVTSSGDADDVRRRVGRRVLLDELPAADRETASRLLDQFVARRLVTTDRGSVQIAHEALLRHWPVLSELLSKDRDGRLAEQRLTAHANEWDQNGRPGNLLLSGKPLASITSDLDESRIEGLGATAREYLDASIAGETRARRRRVAGMAGIPFALLLVAALVAGFLYSSHTAAQQTALAQSGQFSNEAAALQTSDPRGSLWLSLKAFRTEPGSYETASGLLSAQSSLFTTESADPAGGARGIAYGPPGTGVFAVAGQNGVTVHDLIGGQSHVRLLAGKSPFYAVAFDRNGHWLAGAEQDGTIIVWSTSGYRQAARLQTSGMPKVAVNAVAFSPDGQTLATGGDDGKIRLWSMATHAQTGAPLPADAIVNGLAFNGDGTQLAAADSDHEVRLWDLVRHREFPLGGHSGPVRAVAFSPASSLLASAGDDGTIRLWNPRTRASLGTLRGGASEIDALSFNPAGTMLASGGADDIVRLWNVSTFSEEDSLTGPAGTVTGIAFSADGQTLASADLGGRVGTWNVPESQPMDSAPVPAVISAARRSGVIATASSRTAIDLWHPGQPASFRTVRLPPPPAAGAVRQSDVPDMALSADGRGLAVIDGAQVQLWDTGASRLSRTLKGAGSPLTVIAYSADSADPVIAAGASDGTVYVWHVNGSGPPETFGSLPSAPVTSIAFSPDGSKLAAGSQDGSILLAARHGTGQWSGTAEPLSPSGIVEAVAFSPDDRTLATALDSGPLQLRDITRPDAPVIARPGPATEGIISMAFSDSGKLAVSYDGGSILLWSLRHPAAPDSLATLNGRGSPTSVTWTPHTDTLVGAAAGGTLLTWDTDPAAVARRICALHLWSGTANGLCPGRS